MNNTDFLPPALFLALAAHDCGPTEVEAGRAVMFAGLPALAGTLAFMLLFLRLWREVRAELSMRWTPAVVALVVMALMCLASLLGVPAENGGLDLPAAIAGVMEWVPIAILAVGTSYLAVVLVVWRIWLQVRPQTAFSWAFLPPLVLLWWPAPLMGFGLTANWTDFWVAIWVFTGYVGLVTGPLLLILLVEILVRIRKARKRTAQDSA